MKNLNEFIIFINDNLTGKVKSDIKIFMRKIIGNDTKLSVDEAIEVLRKCPKLAKVFSSLKKDGITLNNSSLYDAYKLLNDDKATLRIRKKLEDPETYHFDMKEYLKNSKDVDIAQIYLGEISKIPLLTREETTQLFIDYENGDEEARNKIIEHNLKLVVMWSKKYLGRGLTFMDLIQEGSIGLMRAVDKYNYRLGYTFSTYASCWIKQAMSRGIDDKGLTIKVPVYIKDLVNKMRRYIEAYTMKHCCEPTNEDIVKDTEIPESKVELCRELVENDFLVSLDSPVNNGEDNDTVLGDFVESENNDFENLDEKLVCNDFREELYTTNVLKPREVTVLKYRYGFVDGQPHTLEYVGKILGVTRERVRQIEVRALKKLRRNVKYKKFNIFDDEAANVKYLKR